MLLLVQYHFPAPNSSRRHGKWCKLSPRACSVPSRTQASAFSPYFSTILYYCRIFFFKNFLLKSCFCVNFFNSLRGKYGVVCDLQRIMEKLSSSEEVGGAGGAYSYNALKRLDQVWSGLRSAPMDPEKIPQVVSRTPGSFPKLETRSDAGPMYDVIVCGGTLGIFVATALASKGLNVGVVERNILKGREQEWNISRKELLELVQVGVLSNDEAEYVIASEFNPNRCGFENKGDIWVQNILNLGVSPAKLLDVVKKRFIALGGALFEARSLSNISIYDDAAILTLSDGEVLSCRLVVDSMGNFSPIVRQIRCGRKPDGMCLVVGTCCRGFDTNTTSDVIYSSSSAKNIGNSPVQYFWEAFPAGSGPLDRTTYMFTYVDTQGGGPTLEDLLEDYWDLMPSYQPFASSI